MCMIMTNLKIQKFTLLFLNCAFFPGDFLDRVIKHDHILIDKLLVELVFRESGVYHQFVCDIIRLRCPVKF